MTSKPRILAPRGADKTVFVCRKCLKRHRQGKKIAKALQSVTKAMRASGSRRTKIVKTTCFGICPKRAVLVSNAALLAEAKVVLFENADQVAKTFELTQDRTETR